MRILRKARALMDLEDIAEYIGRSNPKAALRFLDPRTRLLIIKDFRTFRRDPAQWAQVVIFSGLLTLYFANIRNLFAADIPAGYQNGISLLNLLATALPMVEKIFAFIAAFTFIAVK